MKMPEFPFKINIYQNGKISFIGVKSTEQQVYEVYDKILPILEKNKLTSF